MPGEAGPLSPSWLSVAGCYAFPSGHPHQGCWPGSLSAVVFGRTSAGRGVSRGTAAPRSHRVPDPRRSDRGLGDTADLRRTGPGDAVRCAVRRDRGRTVALARIVDGPSDPPTCRAGRCSSDRTPFRGHAGRAPDAVRTAADLAHALLSAGRTARSAWSARTSTAELMATREGDRGAPLTGARTPIHRGKRWAAA